MAEKRLTDLAKAIDKVKADAKYDQCAELLLSFRIVIAWILKECTEEFKNYDLEFIMECIEGDVEIASTAVPQGEADREKPIGSDDRVRLLQQEAGGVGEKVTYYDVIFTVHVPRLKNGKPEKGAGLIKIIINLEAQLKTSLPYPLPKRVEYYGFRSFTSQLMFVKEEKDYNDLCKVYSIWICPNPTKTQSTNIVRFYIQQDSTSPDCAYKKEDYANFEGIILFLAQDANVKSGRPIIDFLTLLFSATVPPEEKKARLQEEYHVEMEKVMEEVVQEMGGLSAAIAAQYEGRLQALMKENEDISTRYAEGMEDFAVYMLSHGSTLREIMKKTGLLPGAIYKLAAENSISVPHQDEEPFGENESE